MKLPIIILEGGDISLFESAQAAEQHLEAIDVLNNEYAAFDASGRPLELRVVKEKRRVFSGIGAVQIEVVKVGALSDSCDHSSFRKVLESYLHALGKLNSESQELSIDQLVELVAQTAGVISLA